MTADSEPHSVRLALDQITKAYPAVVANDSVDLLVRAGEIHAVLGENGAGKSTLMKIIYGVTRPDSGHIHWEGRPVTIDNPATARALGIGMVFQHFSLFDTLTVAENIALGLPPDTHIPELSERIVRVTQQYGMELDPKRHVHTLSVGERQRVEIVRALLGNPRLLILDEPTSVLTPQAVEHLFTTLRQLAANGCSIVYISHKLDEIRALCHRCTVMRRGRVTGVCDPRNETSASLSRMMTGAEPERLPPHVRPAGNVVLAVQELSVPPANAFATGLDNVSFSMHAGEILGVAGISGNGQQELLALLSGEDNRASKQSILLEGQPIGHRSCAWRRARGVGMVPEERLGRGAVPDMSLADNLLLSHQDTATVRHGFVRSKAVRRHTANIIERFSVAAPGPQALAMSLSGGNLQKYIIGREITRKPRVLLVAQPTWGVDVGAAARIRSELIALREAGCAVLVISEELDELFDLSDRLVVIAGGRLSPPIDARQATRDMIGQWMSGLWPGSSHTVQEAGHAAP